jgi:hypothetical protein
MKTLQNDYTTREQSKRLLELGVPASSADCYYGSYGGHPDYVAVRQTEFETEDDALFRLNDNLLPCWSVGRLIEIMKECSIPVTTWYIKSDSKKPLLEYFMDDLESALMERDMDFSKLEE